MSSFDYRGKTMSWTLHDQTLRVTLHRDPCNEIGLETLAELEQLLFVLRAPKTEAPRALIWHSALPTGFSAGADLRALYVGLVERDPDGTQPEQALDEIRTFIDRIHDVFDGFDQLPMPTIAVVRGVVFGGGFELALTADVLIAEKSARFCFPELRLGLVPGFGGIPRLQRDVGNAVVRDLLFTGRSMRASSANKIGLVQHLVANGQGLQTAKEMARQMNRFDSATVAKAKRFSKPLPREALDEEKRLFLEMFASPTVRAALKRFAESDDLRPYLPS